MSDFLSVSGFCYRKIIFPLVLLSKCRTETERHRSGGSAQIFTCPGTHASIANPDPSKYLPQKTSFSILKKIYSKHENKVCPLSVIQEHG